MALIRFIGDSAVA